MASITQTLLLDASHSSPGTCTVCVGGGCASAPHRVIIQAVADGREPAACAEMRVISPTTTSVHCAAPAPQSSIASHVSHSARNLLYDGEVDTIRHSTPTPTPTQSPPPRPWLHHRSLSLPPKLTLPLAHHTPSISTANPKPLSTGPSGNTYTPLSARPTGFESLRHDHGIRYVRRVPFTAFIVHWQVWVDEDAAPQRLRERVVKSVERKGDRVKGWFKRKLGGWRKG